MKFIKKNIKLIVTILACMLLVSGVSVYSAYKYFATDVSYKRDGKEMSVAEALNELYINKKDYNAYITLSGKSGVVSDTKMLSAGTYRVDYFSTCYSSWGNCPVAEVYINETNALSTKGSCFNETWGNGSTAFSCGGGSTELKINTEASIYLKITGGKYQPYGMITIIKVE